MRRLLSTLLALLIAIGNVGSVLAESTDMESLFYSEIPTVFTASKKAEKVTEAPGTVYVVTKAEIRARGYSNLKDVLRDLPGMETIENSLSEWGTEVPVRGVVGNNKIAVLVNGIRVNPPGGENFPFRSDFSVREAEQIEVVYGPGSTLYGQDAISMVINVITETPREGLHAEIGLGGHSLGGVQGWATGTHKGKEVDVVAHVQYQHAQLSDLSSEYSDYYHATHPPLPGDSGKPVRWDDGFNGFVRLSGKNTSVQVWYRDSSRSSAEGGYGAIQRFARQANWGDSSSVISLENNLPLSDKLNLASILTHNKYEIDPSTRYVFPNGVGGLVLNNYKYGVGLGTTLEERLTLALDKTTVIAGMEFGNYDIKPKATYPSGADRSKAFTDQAGTFDYYTSTAPLSALTRVSKANDLTYSNLGGYVEGTIKPMETLKVILGGRVDKNTRFKQVPFSPRAAAVYNLTKKLTTKYVYSKAFVYPAPYFGYNNYINTVILNLGNDQLEPEKATSHEINLSWDTEKLNAYAAVYLNKQENLLIVGDRATPVNIIQNPVFLDPAGTQRRILTHTANAGESTSKGLDLSGKLKMGKSSLWASYSYVDFKAELLGVTTSLDQISRHNIRLGSSVALGQKWLVTPSLIYRSTPVNLAEPVGLEGIAENPYEVNLHVIYTPVPRLDLFADVRNLTNNQYGLRGVLSPVLSEPLRVFAGVRLSL